MKKVWIWIIAIVLTILASVYQRMSGPTYPLRIKTELNDSDYSFQLTRSASTSKKCKVEIPEHKSIDKALMIHHKYPGNFAADSVEMQKDTSGDYVAYLPVQPAAGKMQYYIALLDKNGKLIFSNEHHSAIIRYKNDVPAWALIPHVIAMFAAILLSIVTLLMIFAKNGNYKRMSYLTFAALIIGGFIFGPIVQHYAFGQAWTGWPVGKDLTDNKVLIAAIFWIVAILLNIRKNRKWAIVLASVVLIGIFSIPHSARGSEFNYEEEEIKTGK